MTRWRLTSLPVVGVLANPLLVYQIKVKRNESKNPDPFYPWLASSPIHILLWNQILLRLVYAPTTKNKKAKLSHVFPVVGVRTIHRKLFYFAISSRYRCRNSLFSFWSTCWCFLCSANASFIEIGRLKSNSLLRSPLYSGRETTFLFLGSIIKIFLFFVGWSYTYWSNQVSMSEGENYRK